jgi:site-specific DNA-adenine methylase
MARYHGGKQRIGKKIAETIFDISEEIELDFDFTVRGYCEPFCGMLGVYQHIPELFINHVPHLTYEAGDMNESVIKMWKRAQKGWVPPTSCTESNYNRLKNTKTSSAEKGYIGHQFGFGGQYFKGFIGKYNNPKNQPEASRRVVDISKEVQDVIFTAGSYRQFDHLTGYIIYCDPPYSNTECYYKNEEGDMVDFNHKDFWDWVEYMSHDNIVFVSEYKAPKNFKQILKNKRKATSNGKKTKGTEKLFLHKHWL